MIDPSQLEHAQDSEEFNDAADSNDAFQLESLPSYPGELPFETGASANAMSTHADAAQESPAVSDDASSDNLNSSEQNELKATLEAELARSQQKKSKKDSLEDSINRLKEKLQVDPLSSDATSAASVAQQATSEAGNVTDLPSAMPAATSAMADTFEELPVELPLSAAAPSFDEALVDAMPSTQESIHSHEEASEASARMKETLDDNNVSSSADIAGDEEAATPRSEKKIRLSYGIAAVLAVLSLSGAGLWWRMHSGTTPPPADSLKAVAQGTATTPTTAEHSNAASTATANPEQHSVTESQTTPTQEHAGVTAQEAAHDAHESHDAHDNKSASESHDALAVQQQKQAQQHEATKQPEATHPTVAAKTPETHTKPAIAETKKPEQSTAKPAQSEQHGTSAKTGALATAHPNGKQEAEHAKQEKKESVDKHADQSHGGTTPSVAANQHVAPDKVVTPGTMHGTNPNAEHTPEKTGVKKPEKTVATANTVPTPATNPAQGSGKNSVDNKAKPANADVAANNGLEPRMIAKPVLKTAPSSKGLFTVQVYASPSRDDAEEWMKRLQKKNINGSSMTMQQVRGTTYYRVRFGSFASKEEAEGAALNSGFASSWVDRIK